MSPMALLLSVLASWTSSVAAKGPDSSCLLQTMAGQNRQNLSDGLSLPVGWSEFCQGCFCKSRVLPRGPDVALDPCIAHCQGRGYSVVASGKFPGRTMCFCCEDTALSPEMMPGDYHWWNMYQFRQTKQISAEAIGDPHIKTLDGRSYTLLSQGTFLLWHLAMETELPFSGGESEFEQHFTPWNIAWMCSTNAYHLMSVQFGMETFHVMSVVIHVQFMCQLWMLP